MAESRNWTYEQTLIAFRVYLNTEYGKLNQSNTELAEIAKRIDRTPSALIMKCCNFASMDPLHAERGVKGLVNKSQVEKQVWQEFQEDSDIVIAQMEEQWDSLGTHSASAVVEAEPAIPSGPAEVERTVVTRRLQGAFRSAVMVGYKHRCALTGLNIPTLLIASHIIPWAHSEGRRADPRNGLCLNALHDRAFDRGLLTFDEEFRVVISPSLQDDEKLGRLAPQLKLIEGQLLSMPERFGPSHEAMSYHREQIFQSA
jgi:predicted restriction endonuclease